MMRDEDIESRLRALTPKAPPPELRDRVLRRAADRLASRRRHRRAFLPKLVLACAVLMLVLLDVSVARIQDGRIASLTGAPALASRSDATAAFSLAALRERRLASIGLLEGTGLP
jgi:hypothetical protein